MAIFQHDVFSVEDASDNIMPEKLGAASSIFQKWKSLHSDGRFPHREDFGFRDFGNWHSYMIISDFVDGGKNLSFRLIGESVKVIFGGQLKTGKRFSDAPFELFPEYNAYFSSLSKGAVFGICLGKVPIMGEEHKNIFVLDLPMANQKNEIEFLYSFFAS